MQIEILKKIIDEVENRNRAALVFITEAKGSVPGAKDSMMAVLENGDTFGTIGGGPVEYTVTKQALKAIKKGKDETFYYELNRNSDLNMICGGNNRGYIKVFKPKPELIIFGAGHVGQKLARIAAKTNFDVTVVDPREDFKYKEDLKEIKNFYSDDLKEAVKKIKFKKEDTFVVICTPNSDTDVLREILDKDYNYIGMIGSRHKVKTVFDRLINEDIDKKLLDKIHSPIGLDIDNGTVEEIAVSIISEILAIKNGKEV